METITEHYIAGRWTPNQTSESIPVHHAATEEIMASVPAGSLSEADLAVSAARAAFPEWSATCAKERGNFLRRIATDIELRSEEIARSITAEVGMPLRLSRRIQAQGPAKIFAQYAQRAQSWQFEERVGHSRVVQRPAGVVAAITPWNYPLHQVAAKVAPALAAGCTVVLKPSEVAPLTAYMLARIIESNHLPRGVFNLITGHGPEIGEALVAHPEVDLVSFTGSTRAGKRVAELASTTVKRVLLELGGKSAAVLLDDADLGRAVKSAVNSCFLNSGQTCSAQTRLLVPEHQFEQAASLALDYAASLRVGDPFDPNTALGPLASSTQRERVRYYIAGAISAGIKMLTGGLEPPPGLKRGYFVQPTLFGPVAPRTLIAQEEIFGPVMSILTFRDDEEAVALANGTSFGLAGAVWSADLERAQAIAARLRCGQVDVNGGRFNYDAPFGGFKQSGIGREMGDYGMHAYCEYQSLNLPSESESGIRTS